MVALYEAVWRLAGHPRHGQGRLKIVVSSAYTAGAVTPAGLVYFDVKERLRIRVVPAATPPFRTKA